MKRKIQIHILAGILIMLIVIFGIWFFSGDKTEKLCREKCEDSGWAFSVHKISENYNFIECDCSFEGNLKLAYFDLNTKRQLTSNQVLNRVIG